MAHHYQAIVTKYLGPGNVRGSRVKATAAAGSITLAWDGSLGSEANHAAAAQALANKFKWRGTWFSGGLPDKSDCVFVQAPYDNVASGAAFKTDGEN